MKTLKKGKDKIQYICDELRKETLEPAKKEASEIILRAEEEAENLIKTAEENADKIVIAARECMERERSVFQSSLAQAAKQSMEALRQEIENNFFNEELLHIISKELSDEKLISKLIAAIIDSIEREGMGTDFSAVVSSKISSEKMNALIGESICSKLREKSVTIGNFFGGAQLKIHDKKITIDITDSSLKELIGNYLRKDFRQMFFKSRSLG